jgi:dihydroflavonol-4-reductase
VAVTGAAGHIGANLVRALLAEGRTVRAIVHQDNAALEGLAVEQVRADILDPESLHTALEGAEVVYHLAARITLRMRDPEAVRINVEGTRNVVEACTATGVRRVIHFSSIHAFSPIPVDEVVDETRARCDDPSAAAYDQSKAEGERIVLGAVDRGLDAVIVNPTGVMGPHDFRLSDVGRVVVDVSRRRMPVIVKGGFNWVDARDVCIGAMAAERAGRTGKKYLLAGHYLTVPELARMIAEAAGVAPPPFTVPIWMARLGIPFAAWTARMTGTPPRFTKVSLDALENHQEISHAKAENELGYSPRPIQETVEDTVAWFRDAGRL